MKTPALNFLLFLFVLLGTTQLSYSTSYQWVGNTSTDWATASNWSPSGVPDSADHITVSSGTYNLVLDQNRRVSNLTLSTKTINLNGYSLTVYGIATMTSGTVTGGNFIARGSLAAFNGTLMDCPVDAVCGYIRLSGSTFNETTDFADTGTATGTGTGGCTFNDDVTITHGGTLTYFTLANTNGDTFNGNVTFTNNSNRELYVATNGSTQFNGNIILNNTSTGGILFGNGTGTSTLASGKTVSIGTSGFSADFLTLKNFTQSGSTAQSLTLTGSAAVNMIGVTFNGNLTVSAPGFLMKNSVFSGTSSFTKTGTGNHQSDGGNTFNGATTIAHTGASGRIRMATITGDTYNADVTFNSSGQDVQIAYLGNNSFTGNITINSNKVVFNTSTGKVTFTGTNNQTLNGSYNYSFKKVSINKSSGHVYTNSILSIDDSLFFIKGNLVTKANSELVFKINSKAISASDSSMVVGPVKKIGSSAFIFPTGFSNVFRPIEISAPSTSTSEFVAEYIEDSIPIHSSQRDATLGLLLRNKYWKLNRTVGNSDVFVSIGWDSLHAVRDTFITIASWDGSKWADLGKGTLTGSKVTGKVKSAISASAYYEFILSYISNESLPTAFACSNVTNANDLLGCLTQLPNPPIISISSGFPIDNPLPAGSVFPLEIQDGTTLQGVVGGNSPKWWEPQCPLITTNWETVYVVNVTPIENLYLFKLQEGAVIQNLRIRGPQHNLKTFHFGSILSGGIYVSDGGNPNPAKIINCEISCFSQAGIWKDNEPENLIVENCFIHNVKGVSYTGIGYGVWSQSKAANNPAQNISFINNIFDDCKAAIDDSGYPHSQEIKKCSFSQFFLSEDINKHNDERFTTYYLDPNGVPVIDYHLCYSASQCTGQSDFFYGVACSNYASVCSTSAQCSTYPNPNERWLNPPDVPIYNVAGGNTIIESCIFHKNWLSNQNGNISLPYPNIDTNKGGDNNNKVSIKNNTFATKRHEPSTFAGNNHNRGGHARIADNFIDACVWSGDVHIVRDPNFFSYKTGTVVTGLSPQPHELSLNLLSNGTTLPTSYTARPNVPGQFIQYCNLGTSLSISTAISNVAAPNPFYVIRANSNNNPPVNGALPGVISSNNYFFDQEYVTNGSSPASIAFNKPGLYGIDVLGFDATAVSQKFDFKASRWQYIPVIINDPSESKVLYFNIKDSYLGNTPIAVSKQVSINGHPIWNEGIDEGGDGWEYIRVDLTGSTLDAVPVPILSIINSDGTENKLTFDIVFENNQVATSALPGLFIWIDDVYLKKSGSTAGDNALRDGSIEITGEKGLCALSSIDCMWAEAVTTTYTCTIILPSGSTITVHPHTNAGASGMDRKSGSYALYLEIPRLESYDSPTTYNLPAGGGITASVETAFDFKDLFTCSDFSAGNNPLGFTSFPSGAIQPGAKYYLSSDLTISSGTTLTLEGNKIAIAPAVTITIQDGGTLELKDANNKATMLFACGDMWNGIVVEEGGELEIRPSSSYPTEIYDAITAIDVEGGTSFHPLNIRHALFDGNYVGLNLEDATYYNSTSINDGLLGIDFKCTGGIIQKQPYAGLPSYAHVQLEDVSNIQIGGIGSSPSSYTNTFSDALFGIKGHNSQATIINNEFRNITSGASPCWECGSGIYFENTDNAARDLVVGGPYVSSNSWTAYLKNSFDNSKNGVLVRGNHVTTIQSNSFNNVYQGIRCNRNFENITIDQENAFSETKFGVILFNSRGDIVVDGNVFNDPGVGTINPNFYRTAITVQNPSANRYLGQVVSITNNEITDYRIGIHAANVQGLNIGGYDGSGAPVPNEINYHLGNGSGLSNYHTGIWLQNCDHAVVKVNTIINDALISSNPKFMRGLVADNSTFLNICGNTVEKMAFAMQFEGDCQFSELKNNTINDYITGINYINAKFTPQGNSAEPWDNKWIQTNTNTSLIKVDGNLDPPIAFDWSFRGADVATGNDFSPNPYSSDVVSADPFATGPPIDCIAETLAVANIDRDAVYGPVIADTIIYSNNQENYRYLAREALFNLLSENTALLTISSSLDSAFAAFYDEMRLENTGKFDSVQMAINTNELVEAGSLNEAIDDDNSMEANRKVINNIQINKIEMDIALDAADTTALESIYGQHWKEGGLVTYEAAAILFKEYYTEENSLRVQNMLQDETALKPETKKDLGIYPNPAKGKIYFDRILSPLTIVKLFDSSGRLIISGTATNELDIRGLEDGFYVLKVIDGQINIFYKNVVIIK